MERLFILPRDIKSAALRLRHARRARAATRAFLAACAAAMRYSSRGAEARRARYAARKSAIARRALHYISCAR